MERFENDAFWKRCFLKTLFSSVDGENDAIWRRWRHQNSHDWAPDHSIVSIQNGEQLLPRGFNFAGRYIEMRMHRVDLSMRTEGIKAFSKRIFWNRQDHNDKPMQKGAGSLVDYE